MFVCSKDVCKKMICMSLYVRRWFVCMYVFMYELLYVGELFVRIYVCVGMVCMYVCMYVRGWFVRLWPLLGCYWLMSLNQSGPIQTYPNLCSTSKQYMYIVRCQRRIKDDGQQGICPPSPSPFFAYCRGEQFWGMVLTFCLYPKKSWIPPPKKNTRFP